MPVVEVEELVGTLAIPNGAESQRLDCPGLRGVLPVFTGVGALSKLKESMLGELNGMSGNNVLQAKRIRDAILGGEAVEP